MFDHQKRKKYGWSDSKENTEDPSESKDNSSYIVYKKEGRFVKEYPDGKIIPLLEENA